MINPIYVGVNKDGCVAFSEDREGIEEMIGNARYKQPEVIVPITAHDIEEMLYFFLTQNKNMRLRKSKNVLFPYAFKEIPA